MILEWKIGGLRMVGFLEEIGGNLVLFATELEGELE